VFNSFKLRKAGRREDQRTTSRNIATPPTTTSHNQKQKKGTHMSNRKSGSLKYLPCKFPILGASTTAPDSLKKLSARFGSVNSCPPDSITRRPASPPSNLPSSTSTGMRQAVARRIWGIIRERFSESVGAWEASIMILSKHASRSFSELCSAQVRTRSMSSAVVAWSKCTAIGTVDDRAASMMNLRKGRPN
jgi:hypothetical protein